MGVDYWVLNVAGHKRDLVYSCFDSCQNSMRLKSAQTDIARLVSLELLTAHGGTNYTDGQIEAMITRGFQRCKRYESQNDKPLKIYENWIQEQRNDVIFPFPITAIIDNQSSIWRTCFDENANEVTCDDVQLLGKVSYRT